HTEWRTISYHGNSLNSLISGLSELIVAQHTPEEDELLKQLKTLELEMIKAVSEIKELTAGRFR
ncbi:MAG: hypothetical protein ACW97P_10635, partial [Candidatus Hodarchaeales archaeon]